MTVIGLNSRGSGVLYDSSKDGQHFYTFRLRGTVVASLMVDENFKIHAATPDGSNVIVLDADAEPIWDQSLNDGKGGQRPAGWSVATIVWMRRGELLFDLHLGDLKDPDTDMPVPAPLVGVSSIDDDIDDDEDEDDDN